MRKSFLVILVSVFFSSWPSPALAQRWCKLCAMDLVKYKTTKYIITLNDDTKINTCSIHCAAIVLNKEKEKVTNVEAADYLTGKMLTAKKAFYVLSSDIRGVMSKKSKLAFSTQAAAHAFLKEHGGEMADFKDALSMAMEDLDADMTMVKEKVKMMVKLGKMVAEKKSCFSCHGINGQGGIKNPGSVYSSIPGWRIPQSALSPASKSQLKEMITHGITKGMKADSVYLSNREKAGIKMPAWKGLIKGKELHALVNYIWHIKTRENKV